MSRRWQDKRGRHKHHHEQDTAFRRGGRVMVARAQYIASKNTQSNDSTHSCEKPVQDNNARMSIHTCRLSTTRKTHQTRVQLPWGSPECRRSEKHDTLEFLVVQKVVECPQHTVLTERIRIKIRCVRIPKELHIQERSVKTC